MAPDSVDLTEVAAFGASGVVIAVGKDATTGQARIFRRAAPGAPWVEDTITLPGALSSNLVDVDLSQSAAWAVGTYVDSLSVTHPLTLRIGGGEPALTTAAAATWAPATGTLPDSETPTAVAIRGTDGLVATNAAGAAKLHPFHDGTGAIDASVAPEAPSPLAGPINAIALHADGMALTAGELQPAGGTNRIYMIDLSAVGPKMLPVGSVPSGPNLPMIGIGADSLTEATAVESNPNGNQDPGTWSPGGGVWTRDDGSTKLTQNSRPSDLSLRKVSGTLEEAVAGTDGGAGAVWWRSGGGEWSKATPTSGGEALNGVTVIAANDIWAAGDDGEVVHYAPKADADPPNTFIDSGPPATTNDPMATFTFSSDTGTSFECSIDGGAFVGCTTPRAVGPLTLGPHTFQVKATGPTGTDLTPASRTFTVVAPETTLDGPSGTTNDTTPTFVFASDYAGASFQCSLDGSAFFSCTSALTTSELAEGDHTFQVRAVSSAAADPSPATQSFKIDLPDGPCTPVPRPLVRDVTVRKRRGMLLIEFDLAADARVKAKAFHNEELIGRTKEKVLKQGHHEIKLRYGAKKGKPTRLKMLARPAATDACR